MESLHYQQSRGVMFRNDKCFVNFQNLRADWEMGREI